MAYMSTEQAEMNREELASAIRSGDPNDELFASMTSYLKDIPGSAAQQYTRSQEAIAIYRSILLMEQNHPALFYTQSSAEHLAPFTQAILATLDGPPVAADPVPDLRTHDAGDDYERRCQLVSQDPVASQMAAFELLDSSRRMMFRLVGVEDHTGAHEDQDRGGGEHMHLCCCLGSGQGVPRSEAMDPAKDWYCPPYIQTKKGQQHHVRYFKDWIATAKSNGDTEEESRISADEFRQLAHRDPRKHPAGHLRLDGPTDDPEVVAAKEATVNQQQALAQAHRCSNDRCLVEDRRRTIKRPVAKVFVLGTPAQVKALGAAVPDLSDVRRLVAEGLTMLVPANKRRFAKVHSVKMSRAGQIHVDATPTVHRSVGCGLLVAALPLKWLTTEQQSYRRYCKRGHPVAPNEECRLARSARRQVDDRHMLVAKVPREAGLGAYQNQYLARSGGSGDDIANTFGVDADAQTMPEASNATKHCIKHPHKSAKHNRQVKEQIERLLERTDHSELSAAAPLVVNAILEVEHERAVSCQEMARHLMKGTFDGDLATFSSEVTTLLTGGKCGFSGARKQVDVMFEGDGNAILSSKSTTAMLHWSRFDHPCEMAPLAASTSRSSLRVSPCSHSPPPSSSTPVPATTMLRSRCAQSTTGCEWFQT